jgi:hypothetical protein
MRHSATTVAALAALLGLAPACASNYYSDPGERFHIEVPGSMRVGTTAKGNVRMEPGNDTVVTIDSTTTEVETLDAYLAEELDSAAVAHGEQVDLLIADLPAKRLEFRGGIDLGHGLPVFANLVLYLIKDGPNVYRLACSGPDGPFESYCLGGAFDDMAVTFALGGAP